MEIACPCNAVRLRIAAEPLVQFWCHCADCQLAHGAAYVAEAIYPREAVEVVAGETICFAVRTTPRLSCAACGSRLFSELDEIGMRGVNGYLLKAAFKPVLHINCSDAKAPVQDGLPHYANKPEEFGGDGRLVAW